MAKTLDASRNAAQVHDHDEDDETDGDLDPERVQLGQRRDDVVDTGCHRHGDREHVVDQERRGHDHARHLAEVLARHLVVAAARGVGLDELPVAQHDHDEQRHHGHGDPRTQGQQGRSADQQDHQQLLWRVGHGGQRVGGEDRQRHLLREELFVEFLGGEGLADQDAFRDRRLFAVNATFVSHGARHYAYWRPCAI
ncbi:hypothetical protein QE454_001398 [Microbacterium sp. SORGH_AS454]|nr:hypothetical protein [Microbacterium sp. SORGH_AS_0454]